MESFKKIIGGPASDYGILSGNSKNLDAKYLFATIQTISKDIYQEELGKDAFDYILIDEVHKAGATSYIKTIDYFNPEFLLGMTATPERTDGFNIFELFDYNLAYEIRLQEALEEDLLCPFHYFGVTDYEKDGFSINETADLKYLVTDERIDFLINKINYYGCYGNKPKGLVFCSRKEEAKELSALFNRKGIPSSYLSGDHDIEERETEIGRLENGQISYIFTVDIFNEGIDIPKINQIIMLRNTESSIIFIQQLGRGLRKDASKEFVTVIDFIGNYKNNYMIPMALSGDNSNNKSNLRRDTIDVSYISGLSAINFEQIAKEKIFS
jgi:superfamily II DNA or RNA helicase